MYSWSNRLNWIFSFYVTVSLVTCGIVGLTGIWYQMGLEPVAQATPANVVVKMGRLGYLYDYSKPMVELGYLEFDLEADFTSLFNWDTKQVYVYVTVEYSTPKHSVNQVVIWDEIISDKAEAQINKKGLKAEYLVSDLSKKLEGIEAQLTVHWNVMPWVGFLTSSSTGSSKFTFPAKQQS